MNDIQHQLQDCYGMLIEYQDIADKDYMWDPYFQQHMIDYYKRKILELTNEYTYSKTTFKRNHYQSKV